MLKSPSFALDTSALKASQRDFPLPFVWGLAMTSHPGAQNHGKSPNALRGWAPLLTAKYSSFSPHNQYTWVFSVLDGLTRPLNEGLKG